MNPMRYVALTGNLGAGFHEASLAAAMARGVAFIGADAGSTDGGPHYLGTGDWIWARDAYLRDLRLALSAARRADVPLVIGSCGGGGNDSCVDDFAALVDEIAQAQGWRLNLATIYTEPPRDYLVERYESGAIRALDAAPAIDKRTFEAPGHIVAMAGAEPIQSALEAGADVVLVGRCADAAIYAALPLMRGFDPALVWNAAKLMECGAAPAENRRGQDCLLCTMEPDGFVLEPLDPTMRCTPRSVVAHTMYETADPYALVMPSGVMNSREAVYEAVDERRVRVSGGRFEPAEVYTVKLEGATPVGHQSCFWGSVRDPALLAELDGWVEGMRARVVERLADIYDVPYQLSLRAYGADGTVGIDTGRIAHEAVLVCDVVAQDPAVAAGMARAAYHVVLHWPAKAWSGASITGIAHPYSAPVFDRGPVHRFTLNHVLELERDEIPRLFPVSMSVVGAP